MTAKQLHSMSETELRKMATEKGLRGNASRRAKRAQWELTERGWADVPSRPNERELRELEEM